MLSRMQTITEIDADNEPVSAAFEPCGQFRARADAAPVCAACGWLDDEHAPESEAAIAEVRALPRRAGRPAAARRLAS